MLTTKEFIDKYFNGDVERYNAILEDGRRETRSWNDLIRKFSDLQEMPVGLTAKEFARQYCDGDIDRYNAILRDGRRDTRAWTDIIADNDIK